MRFTEHLIYEQSAAQAAPGLQQNRPSAWLRQPLKIERGGCRPRLIARVLS
jgi:hypothetical protein